MDIIDHLPLGAAEQLRLASRHEKLTLSDCYPYHWFDMPNGDKVVGSWDLRRNWQSYLGNYNFTGKRVFEPGPASGFLTMKMEHSGAEVVAFDLPPGAPPDLLPSPKRDMAKTAIEMGAAIDRVRNSWWYFHRAFNLKAKATYGDIYNLPDDLGRFDVTVVAAILLHLSNPFRAIQQFASITDKAIIIADLVHDKFDDQPYMEFAPHPDSSDPMTWWYISPHSIKRMLAAVGFSKIKMTESIHNHYPTLTADNAVPLKFYTLVAER